jgi:hypothetical protein
MLRLSSWLAIAVGALLAAAQIARNYDNLENWPTWGIDVMSGAILVYGGWRALRRRSDRSLAAAWAFAAGLFLSAFVSHYQAWTTADPAGGLHAAEQRIALIVAALLAVSGAGVAMSLLGRKGA